MSPDDLIEAFSEVAQRDPEMCIEINRSRDPRLVPSLDKEAMRRFRALMADAVATFCPIGSGTSESRWLRFVIEHAPELLEDNHPPARGVEHHDDGTETSVAVTCQRIQNAAGASALVGGAGRSGPPKRPSRPTERCHAWRTILKRKLD